MCCIFYSRAGQCSNFLSNIYEFDYPGIGANLMYMALEGVAILALIILIEVYIFMHTSMSSFRNYLKVTFNCAY